LGAWYFELEVVVVGDSHELGIAWTTQDGMVSVQEICYFEVERLHAEVF